MLLPSPAALRHLAGELAVASGRLADARARLLTTAGADGWSGPAHVTYAAAVGALAGRLDAQADALGHDAARVRAMADRVGDDLAALARLEHAAAGLVHRLAGEVVGDVAGELRRLSPW